MAVEAVASVVIQKLTDMLTEESIIPEKVIVHQLEGIKKALEDMRGYFIDAEDKQKTSEQVKVWSDKYLGHLYDVEDTIETFALRFARQRKRLGFLMNHALFLKNFTACRNLSWKIERIRHQINQLNREKPHGVQDASVNSTLRSSLSFKVYDKNGVADHQIKEEKDVAEIQTEASAYNNDDDSGQVLRDHNHHHSDAYMLRHYASTNSEVLTVITDDLHNPQPAAATNGLRTLSDTSVLADRFQSRFMYSSSYDDEEMDIGGFEKDIPVLVRALTDEASKMATRVVSILGDSGSGKTTLARAVYGNHKIKERFKSCAAWVTVSKESSARDLLLKLLKQVGNSKDDQAGLSRITDEQALRTRVFERLNHKKYLIVLDDVGSSDIWDSLQNAFPDQRNGSRILLITCNIGVATHANSHLCKLNKLSHPESWALFLKKAGFEEDPRDDGMQQRILRVCNCLPLNIILLGSLLWTRRAEKWPPQILDKIQANWGTKEIISLSYNDLPNHLKLCLLYLVLFPKEFDIPVRRVKRLWLAEGFVERPNKLSTETFFQEDVVKQYFDNLVKRSLIQVSKLTSDGSPKRCRLLGVLHEYLVPKAAVISLFHVHRKSDSCEVAGPFGARRLVQYTDIKRWDPSQLSSLRSYLSFNIQYRDTPAKEVGKLLRNILANGSRLLRVLDLEGVYKPSLPENLGDFFHLRYLGLRWTFLDALPESVGQLHYLEALDIKHTHINALPAFIWKLKHLKHLYANVIPLDLPSRHLCSSLPQLLTLWGFSVDDESLVKDVLDSLLHLRELGITFHLSNSEGLLDWISKLTAIQTLRLRSKNDMGRPSKLTLKPLSSLKQLTHLNLLGNLPKLPGEGDFPQELKVLTLSVSQLRDDPMPVLGKLPKLTVLRLLANSYLGNTMLCPQGGFKELRVLKLWMLNNLEQWDVEEGAMERLKELNIRCCCKLRMIPCRLLIWKTLKELTLTNMPEEFRRQVEKTKSSNVSLSLKDYKFSPLPWEGANDS